MSDPVEIMARERFDAWRKSDAAAWLGEIRPWDSCDEDEKQADKALMRAAIKALESAGFRIVHPDRDPLSAQIYAMQNQAKEFGAVPSKRLSDFDCSRLLNAAIRSAPTYGDKG